MADIIVKICFDVTELHQLYQADRIREFKKILRCDKEIKKALDRSLSSRGMLCLDKNIRSSKEYIENVIRLFNNIHPDFENRLQIIKVLKSLDHYLGEWQKKQNGV